MIVRAPTRKQYLRYLVLFLRNNKTLLLVNAQNWHKSTIYYDQFISVKENSFQGVCLNQPFDKEVQLSASLCCAVGICLTPSCHWEQMRNGKR